MAVLLFMHALYFAKAAAAFWMFFFILILFPFLNNFRFLNSSTVSLFDITSGLSRNFQAPDFDAYTMLLYTVQYVSDFGYTFGYQLAGTIGFFILRILWESKPIGTGNFIIDSLSVPVNGNVSAPLFAEFYINFGYLGVILLSAFCGCLFHTLDRMYWGRTEAGRYFKMIYPFLFLIIIFVCRGDLMSIGAFTFGTVFTSYMTYGPVLKKAKLRSNALK